MTTQINLTKTNYMDILNDRPVTMRGHVVANPATAAHPSLLKAYIIDSMAELTLRGRTTATRITDEGTDTITICVPDASGDLADW